jgi:hypothetical protein
MRKHQASQLLATFALDLTDPGATHAVSKQRRSRRRLTNWLREHRTEREDLQQRVRQGLLQAKGQ